MWIHLLPGLDGTGDLFDGFVKQEHPEDIRIRAHSLSTQACWSEEQICCMLDEYAETDAPFLLVAESASTPAAIRYAARSPQKLMGLVLVAGFASSPLSGWRRSVALRFAGVLFHLPLFDRVVRAALVGPDAPQSLVDAVKTTVDRVPARILADRLRLVLDCDVRAELAQVTVPTLYILAKSDHLVRTDALAEIRRYKPDIEVVRVPGPHLLMQREPKRMAQIIHRFMQQCLSNGDKI